jgi:hypothetical protein
MPASRERSTNSDRQFARSGLTCSRSARAAVRLGRLSTNAARRRRMSRRERPSLWSPPRTSSLRPLVAVRRQARERKRRAQTERVTACANEPLGRPQKQFTSPQVGLALTTDTWQMLRTGAPVCSFDTCRRVRERRMARPADHSASSSDCSCSGHEVYSVQTDAFQMLDRVVHDGASRKSTATPPGGGDRLTGVPPTTWWTYQALKTERAL